MHCDLSSLQASAHDSFQENELYQAELDAEAAEQDKFFHSFENMPEIVFLVQAMNISHDQGWFH